MWAIRSLKIWRVARSQAREHICWTDRKTNNCSARETILHFEMWFFSFFFFFLVSYLFDETIQHTFVQFIIIKITHLACMRALAHKSVCVCVCVCLSMIVNVWMRVRCFCCSFRTIAHIWYSTAKYARSCVYCRLLRAISNIIVKN